MLLLIAFFPFYLSYRTSNSSIIFEGSKTFEYLQSKQAKVHRLAYTLALVLNML